MWSECSTLFGQVVAEREVIFQVVGGVNDAPNLAKFESMTTISLYKPCAEFQS